MSVASARFFGARPALPSKPWLGFRRAAHRLKGFLEVASFCSLARPERPLVSVSRGLLVGACRADVRRLAARGGSLRFPLPRDRRRVPSPVPPGGRSWLPCSAPRMPRRVRNLAGKIRQKLSLASPNPSGVRAGERQFPLHPRPAGGTEQRRGALAGRPTLPGSYPCPGGGRSARLSCSPQSGTVRHCLPTGRPE